MRQFAVIIVVLAIAVAASAQFTADSQFHAERADGTEVVIPSHFEAADGFIVEFVAPPVAANVAGKTAVDYQATFTRFRNDLATILNAKRSGKTAVDAQIRREYSVVFNGVAIDAPREVIDQVRSLPYVKRVVADMPMHALADGANLTVINAPKVWASLGSRGAGVTVAIIDTGIDYMHTALGKGIGPGFKVKGGWDFVNNDSDPMDDAGHGTHVAGIVAGQSDVITGVAPEASLIAYKVLGATGSGSESNVIAAIERATDPNQDGNTADHVDIANLSLGGSGNPDDPGSVAIDNATAAGVTFAIAAGNSGNAGFHTVSSPGTSRAAITVGASDLSDVIASFSSRGPNMKNITIKPDVVAPGVSIISSYLGNTYASLSGTSMATPHVAGAAALLKALHHDWTPAQIKLALMNNATLVHDDVMAGGAGRIDVFAAATGTIRIDPPAISLGLAPMESPNWTATRSLHVTNSGAQTVTFGVKSNLAFGEKVTPSPATVTIPAGGSTDISLNFAVDNGATVAGAASFTGGGQIVLTNSAVPADVHNVQFAFTKAARATVTFDRAYPDAAWVNESRTSVISGAHLDDNTSEVLMLPGAWDMLIYTREFDEKGVTTGVDFIAREGVALTKDTTIALTVADIPHVVVFGGRRETGETLSGVGYASGGRILLAGATGGFTALSFPWSNVHAMHVSDLSAAKSLLFYEVLLDTPGASYYMIQHPPVTALIGNVNLTTGGSALRGGAVQLALPAASRADRRLAVSGTSTAGGGVASINIVDAPLVNARVYVSPDVHPNYTYGISFAAITDTVTQYTTPLLRVLNDKLVGLTSAGLLPWTYSGSTYEFGLGPRFPSILMVPTSGTQRLIWSTDMVGPLGEVRTGDRAGTTNTVLDTNGVKLTSAGFSSVADLGTKAAYRLEAVNQGTLYPGVNKTTTVSMTVDSSRADYIPPTLTTMSLLDGTGAVVTRLEPHGSGSLLFSAADFGILGTARIYQSVAGNSTVVWYRYSGETTWRSLTATQVTEAPASTATGILYRVDLGSVANIAGGLVDLRFDLADAAGNMTTVTMVPAFSVGPELLPKHRATR